MEPRTIEQEQFTPPSPPDPPYHKESNRRVPIIVIIGIIIFFLLAWFFYSLAKPSTPKKSTTPTPTIAPTVLPTKKISHQTTTVFIRDANVWSKSEAEEIQITTDAKYTQTDTAYFPVTYYSNPALSPDANNVVFFKSSTASESASRPSLYLAKTDGSEVKPLLENGPFALPFKPQWLDNSTILLETITSTLGDTYALIKYNIQNGARQQIAQYNIQSGCGGGSTDPSLGLAGLEGARPLYAKQFALSTNKKYVLHNISCTGYGVNVINLQTGESRTLSTAITQAVFSPDSTKVAGIDQTNHILLYDLASGNMIKILTTTVQPQSLYWSTDGNTIYYGTHTRIKPLQARDILENELTGDQNHTSFWSIAVDGTDNKKLHEFDGYDLRPIRVDANEATLAIVENPKKYFDAMNARNFTNMSAIMPTVNVFSLNLQSDVTQIILANAMNTDIAK